MREFSKCTAVLPKYRDNQSTAVHFEKYRGTGRKPVTVIFFKITK